MRKIISMILAVALIVTAVIAVNVTVNAAADPTPDGCYITVRNRNGQNAGAQLHLADIIKANGAGTYRFSAYIRHTDDDGKSMHFMIQSNYDGIKTSYIGPSKALEQNEWTLFTTTIEYTEEKVEKLKSAYFRVQSPDSSGSKWNYDIDSVTFTKLEGSTYGENLLPAVDANCENSFFSKWYVGNGSATLGFSEADTSLYAVRVKYKANDSGMITSSANNNGGFLQSNGEKAMIYVKNMGDANVGINLGIRANTKKWDVLSETGRLTVEPGSYRVICTKIRGDQVASDNFPLITTNIGNTGDILVCNLTRAQTDYYSKSNAWCLPKDNATAPEVVANPNDVPEAPIGIKFTAAKDDPSGLYTTHAKDNALNHESVVDGKIVKTHTIYNVSDKTVNVKISYQASVNDNKLWAGYSSEFVAIEPGCKATVTVVVPVNDNRTVDIVGKDVIGGTQTVDIKTMFLRLDVSGMSEAGDAIIFAEDAYSSWYRYVGNTTDYSVSYVTEYPVPDDQIVAAAMELGESFTMKYYANITSANASLEVKLGDKTEVIEGESVTGEAYYNTVFSFTGITPQLLGEKCDAVLKVNGTIVDSIYDYGASEYLNRIGANNYADTEIRNLIKDIGAYNKASVAYVSGVSSDVSVTDSTVPTALTGYINNAAGATTNIIKSAGLSFGNVNRIYFRLALSEGARVYLDDIDVTDKLIASGDTYLLYTEGIKPTEFGKVFTVKVVNGEVVSTVSYNVNTYIAKKFNEGGIIAGLVKSLNSYGISAVKYSN